MEYNFERYKYKIDAHCHTYPASKCSEMSPEKLIEIYSKAGVDAVVITNHFLPSNLEIEKSEAVKSFMADFNEACEHGKKHGITVILGMEIRFSQNINDYLVYGIDEEFVAKSYDYLDKGIEVFYKEMKNDKNVILQAHPFRKGMVLANPEYLDGIEAFNMHPNQNSRVAVADKYAKEHKGFIVTAGTDFHHPGHEAMGLTMSPVLPKDSFEFADVLKSRDYIFLLGGTVALPYASVK